MSYRTGNNHPNWKGDNVSYFALHQYVRRHKPFPVAGLCEKCNKRPIEDLANITGLYNRKNDNWSYLCTLCHSRLDRLGKIFVDHSNTISCFCGNNKSSTWCHFDKSNGLYMCTNCYTKRYNLVPPKLMNLYHQ